MKRGDFQDIDGYIATFPPDVQERLQEIRATIRAAAPGATEKISYQIPTFYLHGNLVHFGAFARHIGFFPTASGVAAFERELGDYRVTKGTIQFPNDQPLPLPLIRRIVEYRVKTNLEKQG